jgi:two-component system, chemotaxis family, protein-glutamate methylesterase/glutaminase
MELSLPIRVLVVDDSAVMRSLLRMVLVANPNIQLVGLAQDGPAGLDAMERLNPDLVLLDIEMPCMDGLEVLREIRARHVRSRVIICSTLTRRGASITLEALAQGAADYVTKPVAQHDAREGIATLTRELLPKIFALFPARTSQPHVEIHPRWQGPPSVLPHLNTAQESAPSVVVMGVSTGGPAALERLLPAIPADFPLPILIAQHMPRLFTALLAERLDGLCRLPVHEAEAAGLVETGSVHLARGEWHMEVAGTPAHCLLRLRQDLSTEHCRPSVDVLFRSAASVYGAGVLAVVLTGMGSDGLDGCRVVHAAGGRILVQDRGTSAVWGMPGAVARAGLADQILPLEAIATEITRLAIPRSKHKPVES